MDIQTAARAYRSDPEVARKADEAFQQLLARSATDLTFRKQLLENPRTAIEQFTGRPAGEANVTFVENKADATIVLPEFVGPAAELSESELETVAGGTSPTLTITITVITLTTLIGDAA